MTKHVHAWCLDGQTQYEGRGLAKERAFHFYSLDGEKKERLYLVWTPEGVEFIKELFYME